MIFPSAEILEVEIKSLLERVVFNLAKKSRLIVSLENSWRCKIEKGSDELWYKLLKATHMQNNRFYDSEQIGSSQFWKGLHKVKHMFKWGAEYRVFSGDGVSFWHDSWLGGIPLKAHFNSLFDISNNQDILVNQAWVDNDLCLSFRRSLSGELIEDWENLQILLESVQIDPSKEDEVRWVIDKSQTFTTKSLYMAMTNGGVTLSTAVLSSIPIHFMAAMSIPKTVIKAIDRRRRAFF